eukprot:TRINITY_DN3382_c0_g1_i2.p1 TRINITY_DN3382_c0_g1~~TRINITY_DN3382_c0_g1_i2.p1  ORF type:complete len:304 (+),score=113.59 TRINITY_DN3382_c0_g1_i2:297-1208(+)
MDDNEFADYRWKRLRQYKKKGLVQIQTTCGALNIEVHCDFVPRVAENFMTLCENGYYKGIKFHRNIKNFMIQGGDPTGKGTGGESCWKKPFKDEFDGRLLHSGRGVLSMANSGPNTNGSQFFILYGGARHLDYKHSVFGKVVGGFETLDMLEKIPSDSDDRPKKTMKILDVIVYTNPVTEVDAKIQKELRSERKAKTKQEKMDKVDQKVREEKAKLDKQKESAEIGKFIGFDLNYGDDSSDDSSSDSEEDNKDTVVGTTSKEPRKKYAATDINFDDDFVPAFKPKRMGLNLPKPKATGNFDGW